MPTQSGQLSDPAGWGDPPVPAEWIDELRDTLPAYDPDLTPTRSTTDARNLAKVSSMSPGTTSVSSTRPRSRQPLARPV